MNHTIRLRIPRSKFHIDDADRGPFDREIDDVIIGIDVELERITKEDAIHFLDKIGMSAIEFACCDKSINRIQAERALLEFMN